MEKKKIVICMGSSCFSRGNKDNLKIIQDYIADNDSAEVLLSGALCREKCSKGPILYLGETMHSSVDPDHLPYLLDNFINDTDGDLSL